ncbi:hypothetical protein, conserved [Babesia ovata]|uniref:Extracellular matrix-binding ebh n=1 Tax=Babesia ovata TaxID=189622 RepID=A0A2H6KK53_9APIC|nr:uncharacterized protein BOVATA_048510 [Babesia ovata]GBE63358.1 hypothetical protein, conserved [Babesia ovata]
MSFLHGVLHSIKPKLGLHSNEIQSAITSLNANKHSGKDGFNEAISAVVQGVKGYNEGVRESNKKVNEDFKSEVSGILSNDAVAGDAKLIGQAEVSIKQKLGECKGFARTFNDTLNITIEATKNAINDLDPTLAHRVTNAIRSVKHEIDRLRALSDKEKEELTETKAKLSEAINALKAGAREKIEAKVNELVKALKDAVTEIFKKLDDINDKLAQYVIALNEWAQQAGKDIDAAEATANEIVNKNVGKQQQDAIAAKAEQLKGLKNMFDEYIREVTEKAEDVNLKVKELCQQFPKDARGGVPQEPNKSIHDVFEHIHAQVAQIKGKPGSSLYLGFEGIKDAVQDYAEGFKKFQENVLPKWVEDILESNVTVRHWIGWCGQAIGANFKDPYSGEGENEIMTQLTKKIASVIISKLDGGVIAGIQAMVGEEEDNAKKIDAYVENVHTACAAFADELDKKLAPEGIDKLIQPVGTAMATQLGDQYSDQTAKGYLDWAVRYMLHQLPGAARGAAAELHSLLLERRPVASDNGIARKIEEAHKKAESLHSQLQKATGALASDKYSDNLDKAIKSVTDKSKDLNASHTTPLETLSKDIKEHLNSLLTEISGVANSVNVQLIKLQNKHLKGTESNQLAGITKR